MSRLDIIKKRKRVGKRLSFQIEMEKVTLSITLFDLVIIKITIVKSRHIIIVLTVFLFIIISLSCYNLLKGDFVINKIYEKFKVFMKENYLWLLFYIVFIAVMLYPLPYYIYTGGGILDVNDKVVVDNASDSEGTFSMCYVSEINATLPTYLLSYVIPGWDLVKKEEVSLSENETREDILVRDKIYLEQANQSAILTAYSHTNHYYNINSTNNYIIYVEEESDTDLRVGDIVLNIDGVSVSSLEDISSILNDKEVGSKVLIKVKNNNKEYERYGIVREEEGRKILGIAIITIYDYVTNPKVSFNFSRSESGPSGGLMLSLALYDKLVSEDITKGLKIAGTGTIDEDGNVGSIGGVKYKLKGAVDSKADIFIVPNGDNYEECIRLKKKHNYDIKIIGVSTFKEALDELRKL